MIPKEGQAFRGRYTNIIYLQVGSVFSKRYYGIHPEDVEVSPAVQLIDPNTGKARVEKLSDIRRNFVQI